jgi:hypothetical protein
MLHIGNQQTMYFGVYPLTCRDYFTPTALQTIYPCFVTPVQVILQTANCGTVISGNMARHKPIPIFHGVWIFEAAQQDSKGLLLCGCLLPLSNRYFQTEFTTERAHTL